MKYFKPKLEFILMDIDVICSSPNTGLDWKEDSELGDAGNMDDLE